MCGPQIGIIVSSWIWTPACNLLNRHPVIRFTSQNDLGRIIKRLFRFYQSLRSVGGKWIAVRIDPVVETVDLSRSEVGNLCSINQLRNPRAQTSIYLRQ